MVLQKQNPQPCDFDGCASAGRVRGPAGFTVVELLVSVAVILIVLALSGSGYLKMLKGFRVQAALPEGQMSQLAGLELLRYDIEMSGYGLPWRDLPDDYMEAAADNSSSTPNPENFNDAPSSPPRAVVHGDNTGAGESDVLVLKSARADIQETSRKWSVLHRDNGTWKIGRWNSDDFDFKREDRFIVVDPSKNLKMKETNWFFAYADVDATSVDTTKLPVPSDNSSIHLLYGITAGADLRMPFNRVDYYLKKPGDRFPSRCDPTSYLLYRATINHSDGKRNAQKVLDCVRDFQVGFGLDTNEDGVVDQWEQSLSSITDKNGNGTADKLRKQLRECRVFLLIQDGIRDADYTFDSSIDLGDNDTKTLKTYIPSGDSRHYRWKVLKLAVKPMNLR